MTNIERINQMSEEEKQMFCELKELCCHCKAKCDLNCAENTKEWLNGEAQI